MEGERLTKRADAIGVGVEGVEGDRDWKKDLAGEGEEWRMGAIGIEGMGRASVMEKKGKQKVKTGIAVSLTPA